MRRLLLALAAVVVVAAGLLVHAFAPGGFVGDAAGDALYAVLIVLLVAFVVPWWPSWASGSVALAWCVAVEFFQLTGLPAQWGAVFRPIGLVLGSGFAATDLLFYALGVGIAVAADALIRRPRGRGSRTPPTSASGTTAR